MCKRDQTAVLTLLINITIVLAFIHFNAFTQGIENRIIKKYSINDGLSQAVVNSITQDNKGWMWFATDDGLNRFDGYTFTSFKFDKQGPNQFHDNFVQRIFKDSQGRLWVSSRRGLYHFDLSTQRWTVYLSPQKRRNNDVAYISETFKNKLWIGWYFGGVGFFDPLGLKYDTTINFNLKSTAIIATFEDSYGFLWIGSQNAGLDVFNIRNEKKPEKVEALSESSILPSQYVKCIHEDRSGNMWIGTTKGLVLFVRAEGKFKVLDNLLPPQRGVFSLLEDKHKTLWIGTQGNGLYTVNLQSFDGRNVNKLSSQHIAALDDYDISHHTIRSIFQDRNENIWVGTHGDGVYMISAEEKSFKKFQIKRIFSNAESFVPFYGMCYDDEGNIWAGTDSQGLYKFDESGKVLRHYEADGKYGSIGDDVVYSALRDYNGDLWFGTYTHDIFYYNKSKDLFEHYARSNADAPVPLGHKVSFLFEDSRRNIWVGATRGGLSMVDKTDKTFKINKDASVFSNIDVRAMVEDKKGNLWIGCYGNGLISFAPDTKTVESIFTGTESTNKLKSNIVHALAIDKQNILWIGTGGGGLGAYNLNDKSFVLYTDENGLINNTVFGVQVDEQQNIWCSTINGISKFDRSTKTFFNYTSTNGLQAGQFNSGASLVNLARGYIAFGGNYGINLFYPEKVIKDKALPDVKLSGFSLFNKTVKIGAEDGILEKVIDEKEELILNHDQASFTFEFTALDYGSPEKCEYAYKLDGFDSDWNYVGDQRTASYRYLPPRKYVFKVRATKQRNSWPAKFTRLKISITPPLWRTPVAYFSYVIGFITIGFALVSNRRRQAYLKRRVKIEENQRKRERQLVHDKLAFFTEVSHEFKTPLTLIIGPLEEMLSKESPDSPAGKKLNMVNRNAHKLLTLINKLLDYRKIETGKMVLTIREVNIVSLLNDIFINFKELSNRPNINIDFQAVQHEIMAWIDTEKIEIVLTNIISNSFKYIGNGNTIHLRIKTNVNADKKEFVEIQVQDNGMGIAEDELKYIFDWFYNGKSNNQISSGIGLALAKKMIYLHKGQISAQSILGKGSTFIITIPLGKEHFAPHEVIIEAENLGTESDREVFELEKVLDVDVHSVHSRKGLKTVLVVEDDEEVRGFLKDYLSPVYRVVEAGNGKEALEISLATNIDVIISDVMMPVVDGAALCVAVKNNFKTSHIPVILLTANSAHSHHKAGLETGADSYITKPFSPEILSLTVGNLLQSRENSRKHYRSMFLGDEKPNVVSTDDKLLQSIFDAVKANMSTADLSVDTVGHDVGLSKTILYKKIKQLTGLSPIEYIRSIRISEAAKLLKTKKYKVYEVVYLVGFSDPKYFRKCFIKEFGYPPSQLLESESETHSNTI